MRKNRCQSSIKLLYTVNKLSLKEKIIYKKESVIYFLEGNLIFMD